MMRLAGAVDRSTRTLVLTGDWTALAKLADLLSGGQSGSVDLADVPARGDLVAMSQLVVDIADGNVTAIVEDDAARLSGTSSEMASLGDDIMSFLDFNDVKEPGMHMHLIDAAATADPGSSSRYDLVLAGPVPDD